MTQTSDPGWYARRMGQPTQQRAPQYPPTQGPYQQPQQYPQVPQGYPQQAPQYEQQIDTNQIRVTTENLFEATKYWQGGEAHARERNSCPQCGGQHYFSRTAGVMKGPAPAPMCYDCGFNGMFQQGDPAVWQSGG